MERKLAHIEIIGSISPIKDADRIEVATVNTFKQYLKFQNRMAIGYNVVWCLITLVIILILSA